LINTRDRLLSFLDDEIIDALNYHLRENGVLIRHNESTKRLKRTEMGGGFLNPKSKFTATICSGPMDAPATPTLWG
jgi:pyruvate/2-oxoglutarate dehydrogenase complex dihydrolipoamide dehydrogenase (E3) component